MAFKIFEDIFSQFSERCHIGIVCRIVLYDSSAELVCHLRRNLFHHFQQVIVIDAVTHGTEPDGRIYFPVSRIYYEHVPSGVGSGNIFVRFVVCTFPIGQSPVQIPHCIVSVVDPMGNPGLVNGSYDYDKELRTPYPFDTPDKIWLHRTDDTQKLKDFLSTFANFEIDVHFLRDERGWYFDVGHDGAKDSIHLTLESMLEILRVRDSHLGIQSRIWLDLKNLDSTNATNALHTLQNLAKTYGYPPANFIIESPNYEQLGIFKQAGFFTSYYVPYYSKTDLDSKALQIREHIQHIIESDHINAISFPYYLYEFIKAQKFLKDGEDLPLLTWNEGSDARGNMQTQAFSDPQVKVILAGVKGKYR